MVAVPFKDIFPEGWDRFVYDHPGSTLYHDSAWERLLREAFGYRQRGFFLIKNDEIVGGLLLFEVKGLRGKRLVSSPFRDRGGLLIKDGVDLAPLLNKVRELLQEGRYEYLVTKEQDHLPQQIINQWGLKESTAWVTTKVDLSVGINTLWKNLKNNAQGPVKQAQQYGLRVRIGQSIEDMETFYNIFLRTRKNLGIPSFSRTFFRGVWKHLCLAKKAQLLLAYKNNVPIAGIILLRHKDTAIDGYAASLVEFRHLRANDLLVWKSLEWAVQNGYQVFDFGADSAQQKGLLEFKKKWCGVHKTLYEYFLLGRAQSINTMDSSDKKYRFIRESMNKLPLPLFSWISERIVPRLG